MTHAEHWEPPDPPKLLVSAKRVAEELKIPLSKAYGLCWSLERVFYGPGGRNFRVTMRSLMRFKYLTEHVGLSYGDARETIRSETHGDAGWSPYSTPPHYEYNYMGLTSRSRNFWKRRRWS